MNSRPSVGEQSKQLSISAWRWGAWTVLAYWASGTLAQLIAVPPGYASGFWPPAGIALVSVLLMGRRMWPAVALGSLLINHDKFPLDAPLPVLFQASIVPLTVALGASLQAMVGAMMVRRWLPKPLRLDSSYSVLLFMLIGGIAATIGPTVGVMTLLFSGNISLANAAFNWFTWWVGEGLGVMTFSIICLTLVGRPEALWRSRRTTLLPIMLVTGVAITIVHLLVSRWEMTRQEAEFNRQSDLLYRRVQTEVDRYLDGLYALQAFYQSSSDVTYDDFLAYTHQLLWRLPSFQGVAWNEVVAADGRERLQDEIAVATGHTVTLFRRSMEAAPALSETGGYQVAVKYIAPLESNASALGFLISAEALPADALLRAMTSGQAAATAPITLVQETGGQRGAVIYLPVYRGAPPLQLAQVQGFVSGVFRLGDLLRSVYDESQLEGISMQILDGLDTPGSDVVFGSQALGLAVGQGIFNDRRVVRFADRQWQILTSGTQRFVSTGRSLAIWGVLVSGILFTGLLGAFVLVVTGQRHRADQASARLRDMLETLNRAQEQLVQSEKMASLGGMVAGFAHELNTPLGVAITAGSILNSDLHSLARALEQDEDKPRLEKLLSRSREAAAIALANAQRAGEMIVRFKTLSVDQSTGEARDINLARYLGDILTNFSPSYRHTGHRVELHCPADINLCTVPGGLTQVVVNVLHNCLQHAFVEGSAGRIVVSVEGGRRGVVLRISDDGVGIVPEVVKKIFDPFFTTRRGAGGTGLGLYLVYNIVRQQLRGQISVRSQPGRGTTFEIVLPADVNRA